MNIGLELLASNLYMTFENIVLIVLMLGGLLFYALDVRIGLLIQFVVSTVLYIWFRMGSMNYVPSLILMFITLVMLCITLLFTQRAAVDVA
jgi:hypothetical protein